jgi:hypothetical protein
MPGAEACKVIDPGLAPTSAEGGNCVACVAFRRVSPVSASCVRKGIGLYQHHSMLTGQRRWSDGVGRLETSAKRLSERLDGLLSCRAFTHDIRLEALRINACATALNPIRVSDLDLFVRHGSALGERTSKDDAQPPTELRSRLAEAVGGCPAESKTTR